MPRPPLLLQLADKEKEAQTNALSGVGFVCKVEGSRQEDEHAGGVGDLTVAIVAFWSP